VAREPLAEGQDAKLWFQRRGDAARSGQRQAPAGGLECANEDAVDLDGSRDRLDGGGEYLGRLEPAVDRARALAERLDLAPVAIDLAGCSPSLATSIRGSL